MAFSKLILLSEIVFAYSMNVALAAPPPAPTVLCAQDPKFGGYVNDKFAVAGSWVKFPPVGQGGGQRQLSCISSQNGKFPANIYCFAGIDGAIDGQPGSISHHQCLGIGHDACPGVDYFVVDDTYFVDPNPLPNGEYQFCIGAHNEHSHNERWWQLFSNPY